MSNREINRVLDSSTFDATDLLTLVLLADQATDEGVCFGKIATIAKKIRKSVRQTIRVIVKLHAGRELGVIERRGRSNVFVILSGLSREESTARMAAAVEAEGGEIRPAREAETPDVGVTPTPDVTMSEAPDADVSRIPSLSPAVNPPNGAGNGKLKKERTRDLVFDALTEVFFGIRDYHQIGDNGGRIGKIESRLKKSDPEVTPERIQSFGPWYDRETRDAKTGKSLSRPKDPDKVMEWWGKFNATVPIESEPPKVSEKPVSPLVTQLGVSQAELDANPGLQADLERIYREQGKIH